MSVDSQESELPELDGYEVLGEIGRGGYGVVYKAEQTVLGRTVAIKNIYVDMGNDPGLLERFMREARIVAQIGNHENIVQVFDVKEYNGSPYIIMEFVEGESLADRIVRERTFALPEAIRIISYTLRALNHAHVHNITHRDVKPENVMINKNEKVKVMDFGIAFSGEMPRLTQRGFAVGTPQYMSPEQLRGRPVDGRSDIYSTGVLFYYLATGQLPFDDPDPRELGLKHIKQPANDPRDIDPNIPEKLAQVILKSLEKKPEDRFQTAGEFEEGLQEFLLQSSQPSMTMALAAFSESQETSKLSEPGENMVAKEAEAPAPDAAEPQDSPKPEPEPKPATPPANPPAPEEPAPLSAEKERSSSNVALIGVIVIVAVLAGLGLYNFIKAQGDREGQYTQLLEDGQRYLDENRWDDADEALLKALKLAPTDDQRETVSSLLNNIERKRGQYIQSLKFGRSALERQEHGSAISAFEEALRLKPDDDEALRLLKQATEAQTD